MFEAISKGILALKSPSEDLSHHLVGGYFSHMTESLKTLTGLENLVFSSSYSVWCIRRTVIKENIGSFFIIIGGMSDKINNRVSLDKGSLIYGLCPFFFLYFSFLFFFP